MRRSPYKDRTHLGLICCYRPKTVSFNLLNLFDGGYLTKYKVKYIQGSPSRRLRVFILTVCVTYTSLSYLVGEKVSGNQSKPP